MHTTDINKKEACFSAVKAASIQSGFSEKIDYTQDILNKEAKRRVGETYLAALGFGYNFYKNNSILVPIKSAVIGGSIVTEMGPDKVACTLIWSF